MKYFTIMTFYFFSASPLDPYKRAPSGSSSLIPFPRVGRSVASGGAPERGDDGANIRSAIYFGQKRTGKSSLIPFPRVGRSGPATWAFESGEGGTKNSDVSMKKNFKANIF